VLFRKWLKSVWDKWPKGRVAFPAREKKHIFVPFGGHHVFIMGDFPQFLCDTQLSVLTYIPSFVQIGSALGKL